MRPYICGWPLSVEQPLDTENLLWKIRTGGVTSYSDALKLLNIESLEDRRNSLCLQFAKNRLKVDKLRKMFPKSSTLHGMTKRNAEPFIVNITLTERYLNSAVPQMQRMLNCYQKKQNVALRQLTMPMNHGLSKSVSLRN